MSYSSFSYLLHIYEIRGKEILQMRSMIYYPGFELENVSWLKFALLYFEELRPIIPYMCADRREYLSENAIKIMDNTNLIRPYNPGFEDGYLASVIACDEFERYLRHPERYSFSMSGRDREKMLDIWREAQNQTCQLYYGKFSDVFYDYCIDNRLAAPFDRGIRISQDLAFVYMSLLADKIAKKHGYEMFTEITKYDNLLIRNDQQMVEKMNYHLKMAKEQIEFQIPVKIAEIPLQVIMDLRNDHNFEICRRAYVEEIESFLKAKETNLNWSMERQLEIKRDMFRILSLFFGATASIYLTCSSVASLTKGEIEPTLALAAAYSDFSALKDVYNAPKYFEELKEKVQAKRYLGKVNGAIKKNGKFRKCIKRV